MTDPGPSTSVSTPSGAEGPVTEQPATPVVEKPGEPVASPSPSAQPFAPGDQEHQLLMALHSSNPVVKLNAVNYMLAHPELSDSVMAQYPVQQEELESVDDDAVTDQPVCGSPAATPYSHPPTNSVATPTLSAYPLNMPPGSGPQYGQASDPEKRKLIQQQLVLLLHAHKCQRREREQQASGSYHRPCQLPHCSTMKSVLNHMTDCQDGRSCTYPHCASSRQIITHWKNCQRQDCPVCLPLKNASLSHRPGTFDLEKAVPPHGAATGLPSAAPPQVSGTGFSSSSGPSCCVTPSCSGVSGGMPSSGQTQHPFPIPEIQGRCTQPWHTYVNPDLRQHLVRKLVEAIYPVQDPVALQDRRVASLIQYAMKVEKAMFETATDREEYYQLIAEKIYRIRKELEERRRIKNEQAGLAGGSVKVYSDSP